MFDKLYNYRPRLDEGEKRDRVPLEDWLTECLTATMRALHAADAALLSPIIQELCNIPANVFDTIRGTDTVRIETQVVISGQTRPDIVIYLRDIPVVIIENKIAHSAHYDQLAGYAEWLLKERLNSQPAGIGFVTHYTQPPEQFRNDNNEFKDLSSNATTWVALGKLMVSQCKSLGDDSHARNLALSFYQLLKELEMATEYPQNKSLASAEVFLSIGEGALTLVNELRQETEVLGGFARQNIYEAKPDFELGYYSASRWCNDLLGDVGAEVYAGLWFPEAGTLKQHLVDAQEAANKKWVMNDTAKIFVSVFSKNGLPASFPKLPEDWIIMEDEAMICRDVSSFVGDADTRAKAMKTWVRETCQGFDAARKEVN